MADPKFEAPLNTSESGPLSPGLGVPQFQPDTGKNMGKLLTDPNAVIGETGNAGATGEGLEYAGLGELIKKYGLKAVQAAVAGGPTSAGIAAGAGALAGALAGAGIAGKGKRLQGAAIGGGTATGLAALAMLVRKLQNK